MLTQVSHHLRAKPSIATTSRPKSDSIAETSYYAEYYYLLDSLATIRSICLVTELPGGEELTRDWFVGLFSIVRLATFLGLWRVDAS